MKKLISLLLALPLALQGFAGFAANETTVKIEKTFQSSAGEACTVKVLTGATNTDNIDDLYYLDEANIDEDGNVAFNVAVTDDNTYKRYNYTLTSSSGEKITGSFSTGKKPTVNEAYYLLDEDFFAPKANSTDALERFGWDVLERSADITNDNSTDFIRYGGNTFKLYDNSTTERTVVRRTFEKQTDQKVIVEYRLCYMEDLTDGVGVSLCNGDSEVLAIETKDGYLCANGVSLFKAYVNNAYGVRAEIDLSTKLCNVYINGTRMGTNVALSDNSIDNIRMHTSVTGTGIFNVCPYRINRGYYIADEFVPYLKDQTMPTGVWTTKTTGGSVTLAKSEGTPGGDYLSLNLKDTTTSNVVSIARDMDELSMQGVFEFKAYSATEINNLLVNLGADLKIKVMGDKLCIYNPDSKSYKEIAVLATGLWNTYRFAVDFEVGTVDVRINGKDVASDVKFAAGATSAAKVLFQTGTTTTDDILLDDIYVREDAPLPDDYPTEPQTLNKDLDNSIVVGMQTCDLWHEGKHFGWDKIVDYPSRKTYLGYYDDGNPEVKDWEIKWMVEHGIDYSIHCWYRPGSPGAPIKEPRNCYSINDGLFNCQYKDKLKFAIAFENGGWTTTSTCDADGLLADFKENIVPYWFTYYFNDPDYLTIDNKLIVNIYNINTMVNNLGEDNTKEAITFLREQAVENGFAGVYLIGTTASGYSATLQTYVDYGYDAIYAYSYGTSAYTADRQIYYIDYQSAQTTISYIPTIAMGRDDSAWNRTAGGFTSPSSVETVAQYVKDTYFPDGKAGDALGQRMVVIDNWNEFGEGHFFMPSNLAGFGYLEAIGKVFGEPEHVDTVPSDLGRIGHLFDANRTRESREGTITLKDRYWTFDSSDEGFYGKSSLNSFNTATSNGHNVLYGEVSWYGYNVQGYKDPMFYSPNNLSIPLNNEKMLHMVYRNKSESTTTKIYYITDEDTTWNETKSITVSVPTSMTDYTDIYFKFDGKELGTLKQIRFDPFEKMAGAFYIDLAEIIEPTLGTPQQIITCDGFTDSEGTVLSNVPDTITEAVINYSWTNPYASISAMGYIAEYDETGRLSATHTIPNLTVLGAGGATRSFTMNPSHTYKAFLWTEENAPVIVSSSIK